MFQTITNITTPAVALVLAVAYPHIARLLAAVSAGLGLVAFVAALVASSDESGPLARYGVVLLVASVLLWGLSLRRGRSTGVADADDGDTTPDRT